MKIRFSLYSMFFFLICGTLTAQWQQVTANDTIGISSITANGSSVFAGTGKGLLISSTDSGENWEYSVDFAATGDTLKVGTIAANANDVFVAYDKGIYLSRDNGLSWRQALSISTIVNSIVIDGENVFAGTGDGLYHSTNKGTTWKQLIDNKSIIYSLGVNSPNIYAGAAGGVYVSSNSGVNWKQILTVKGIVTTIILSGTNILAGDDSGNVYLSKNNGSTWTSISAGIIFSSVFRVAMSGNNIYSATEHGNVYISTDFGKTWGMESDNLLFHKVTSVALNDQFIFVGTDINGIWKRKLSDLLSLITSVDDLSGMPSFYRIDQNYPNPFNPVTVINFSIPKTSYVTIKVYDVLGREVTTLVEKAMDAGYHLVNFYAGQLPSGTYIYTIQAGEFRATKKMILMK